MSVKELVFAALEEDIGKKSLTAREVLSQGTALEAADLLDHLRDAQQALEKSSQIWEKVSLFIALADQSMSGEPEGGFLALLIEAYDAERGSQQSVKQIEKILAQSEEDLREEIYVEGRDAAVYGWDASVEYIAGFWGSDAARLLSEATKASLATTKRWISGGSANSWNNRRVVMLAGLLYDLEHKLDWDSGKIRTWLETPLRGSRSPIQMWHEARYFRMPPAIETELRQLGMVS